jgi:hypothetical protein
MFTSIDKALTAAVMGLLSIASLVFGWNFGIGEDAVIKIIAVVTPILVWLVPNKGFVEEPAPSTQP